MPKFRVAKTEADLDNAPVITASGPVEAAIEHVASNNLTGGDYLVRKLTDAKVVTVAATRVLKGTATGEQTVTQEDDIE